LIDPARDRDYWEALVVVVLNNGVPQDMELVTFTKSASVVSGHRARLEIQDSRVQIRLRS
jgi:hypothetical protein